MGEVTEIGEKPRLQKPWAPDPFGRGGYAARGYISRDAPRPHRYWPPPPEADGEQPIMLPRGRKQVKVCASKRDVDGYLEAQVVFTTRGGHRLFAMNEEELSEF